jgi:hypothetical protein
MGEVGVANAVLLNEATNFGNPVFSPLAVPNGQRSGGFVAFRAFARRSKAIMPPKKKTVRKRAAKAVRAIEAAAAAKPVLKAIAGSGDYRPTRFARVAGRGDYAETLGHVGKAAGGVVDAGKSLWKGVKSLFGFGDYRTKGPRSNSLMGILNHSKEQYAAPSAAGSSSGAAGPSQAPFNMGALSVQFAGRAPRLSHREFVGSVVSPENPTEFHTTVYRIQPGLQGSQVLFPWGSSVAGCFKQYVLHGMILEFHSTSSEFAADSALGSVMMSTIYDAEASPLATQIEVDNNEYTTSDKPSRSFYHPIECASKETPTTVRYVRKSNSAASTTDSRFDDVGVFQLSTVGLTASAGTVIGELWATYDIELLKAELPDLHVGTTAYATWTNDTPSVPFTGFALSPESSLPITAAGSTVSMPQGYNGNYVAMLYCAINPLASVASWTANVSSPAGSEVTPLNLFTGAGFLSGFGAVASSNNNSLLYAKTFSTIGETTGGNNSFDIQIADSGTTDLSACYWTLLIIPMDNDIVPNSVSSSLAKALAGHGNKQQMAALEQLLLRLGVDGAASAAAGSAPVRQRAASLDEEYAVCGSAAASAGHYVANVLSPPPSLRPPVAKR